VRAFLTIGVSGRFARSAEVKGCSVANAFRHSIAERATTDKFEIEDAITSKISRFCVSFVGYQARIVGLKNNWCEIEIPYAILDFGSECAFLKPDGG
jgi:hypothetical protein